MIAPGDHYELGELVADHLHLAAYRRWSSAARWECDVGIRTSVYSHRASASSWFGFFGGPYLTAMYGGRRAKVGSRVQAGYFGEGRGFGVAVAPVAVRLSWGW